MDSLSITIFIIVVAIAIVIAAFALFKGIKSVKKHTNDLISKNRHPLPLMSYNKAKQH